MIVTMDGPAGAGKSHLAKLLASRIGFDFLDTGAMYRCVTLACLERGISIDDPSAVTQCALSLDIHFSGASVLLDGVDVSHRIRSPEVTCAIRPVADNPVIRARLVELQRIWAGERNVVTEGRDQGTVAFPNAPCKIYLTASPQERARRRVKQLELQGIVADFDSVLRQQNQRDLEDTSRACGPLRAATDAIYVFSDGLTEDETLDRLVEIVEARRGLAFTDKSHSKDLDLSSEANVLSSKS
ncbi:MAG: (d)CMP kinase [Planctomycetota bacterium]|nr:(d)CMP kinase [Planctomycetota bacterium]